MLAELYANRRRVDYLEVIECPIMRVAQRLWRRFCRLTTGVFYHRREVAGGDNVPDGPLLLCANHANALVDGLIIQASCPRPIHFLARSGLFKNPLLRFILTRIQAVPVYRRPPGAASDPRRNEASFERCFEIFETGRALLIFPEGQSHSRPTLQPLKTGAARLVLGGWRRHGRLPAVVPVGLSFTRKGHFRGDVLVQYGEPIALEPPAPDEDERETVRRYTQAIADGLATVTLNVDSWEDLVLMREIEAFADFRRGRHGDQPDRRDPRRSLERRYRVFQRIAEAHRWLRLVYPQEVELLRRKLRRFARLRRRYGVESYHLELRYRPAVVLRFLARSLFFALLVLPVALWGLVTSGPAYLATWLATRRLARARDQYDSAGLMSGLVFFGLFWSAQTFLVFRFFGPLPALAFASSLPLAAAVTLLVARERRRIVENVRVFFLFLRKREVRAYLRAKREELELEIARLARLARQGHSEKAA